MAEPKGKTLIEKFGFDDKDFKNPKHDDIMFWLDKKIRELSTTKDLMDICCGPVFSLEPCVSFSSSDEFKIKVIQRLSQNPSIYLDRLVWEFELRKDNWTVGFIDLLSVHRSSSFPPTWDSKEFVLISAFEIKTKIPTMGELVRQVRTYERALKFWASREFSYEKHSCGILWTVIAPDIPYAAELKTQGIGSFIYTPNPIAEIGAYAGDQ